MSAFPRAVGVSALVLALACASSQGLRPLTDSLPAGIPAASVRAGWERIAGDYDTASDHVRYALFVDPAQPLLFLITQYRVTSRDGPSGHGRREEGAETVIWNQSPGSRAPLRCFAKEHPGTEGVATSPPSGSWRDVSPATEEYRGSMSRAIEIYGRVHREGRAGPPSG